VFIRVRRRSVRHSRQIFNYPHRSLAHAVFPKIRCALLEPRGQVLPHSKLAKCVGHAEESHKHGVLLFRHLSLEFVVQPVHPLFDCAEPQATVDTDSVKLLGGLRSRCGGSIRLSAPSGHLLDVIDKAQKCVKLGFGRIGLKQPMASLADGKFALLLRKRGNFLCERFAVWSAAGHLTRGPVILSRS
jgi:hypothetical protein